MLALSSSNGPKGIPPPSNMKKYKTACAIIINDAGAILLTKRAREPFKGRWAIISGIGESKKGIMPEIGIVEEVRCDLSTNSFRGEYIFSIPIEGDQMTDEAMVFLGKVNENELLPNPNFSLGYKWVFPDKKEEFENLAFEHSKIIKKYLESP